MLVQTLANALKQPGAADAKRLVVALSGGLDSSALLHALVSLKADRPVHALHVNHGLQDSAARFEAQAVALCASLSVPLTIHQARVDLQSGEGPEAAARNARYAIFESALQAGDCLLSAHHRDDQAETLLLHLMRASGPRGLSGVPEKRALGSGVLLRPLLEVSRASMLEYAQEHGLDWAEDQSNADTRYDRNFLRLNVLPLLESRFPSASARVARSAMLQRDAQSILDDVAEADLAAAGGDPSRLPLAILADLPQARQSNLLRACLRHCGIGEPGYSRTQSILTDLVAAKPDAQPLVEWDIGQARRYRDHLYLLRREDRPAPQAMHLDCESVADLGCNGRLRLQLSSGVGLDPAICERTIDVRYRVGGERLRPHGDAHERSLKSLLQGEAIVPWMRDRVPLIYSGEQLLAVGDLWLNAECCADNGLQPDWRDKPRLY